jgi:PTS system mannose-specific IIA component
MLGIVVVTQGDLAREFIAALEHVAGRQQCISAVCIAADDDMEERRAEILESAKACDTGDGVIVLTDMLGGARRPTSPSRSWSRRASKCWRASTYRCW